MAFDGNLIKIKNIPHWMSEAELLYFLRVMWRNVEDGNLFTLNGQLQIWHRSGIDFEILACSDETEHFSYIGQRLLNADVVIDQNNFVLIPSLLKSFFFKPVFLAVDSYRVSPTDIDQTDVLNSLIACRALSSDENFFEIAPFDNGEISINSSTGVVAFIPQEKETEGGWAW